MHKVKITIILYALCLVLAAIFATIGLVSEKSGYHVGAAWLLAFSLAILFGVLIRLYQRVVIRTNTTNELLKQIKFLQERRYSQLVARMDQRDGGVTSESVQSSKVGASGPAQTGSKLSLGEISELEEINARVQRAERRILGKLENESFDWDRRHYELKEDISDLQEKFENDELRFQAE